MWWEDPKWPKPSFNVTKCSIVKTDKNNLKKASSNHSKILRWWQAPKYLGANTEGHQISSQLIGWWDWGSWAICVCSGFVLGEIWADLIILSMEVLHKDSKTHVYVRIMPTLTSTWAMRTAKFVRCVQEQEVCVLFVSPSLQSCVDQ